MGDRLLKVNDEDVTKMTHQDAVLTLLKPTEEITLTVQHDPLPENFQVIILKSSCILNVQLWLLPTMSYLIHNLCSSISFLYKFGTL